VAVLRQNTPAGAVSLHTIALPAEERMLLSVVSQMTYGPKLSPRTGAREAWLGPTWWLGSAVSMTRTTSLWRAELITHVEGICVESGRLWLHSRRHPPDQPTL